MQLAEPANEAQLPTRSYRTFSEPRASEATVTPSSLEIWRKRLRNHSSAVYETTDASVTTVPVAANTDESPATPLPGCLAGRLSAWATSLLAPDATGTLSRSN